MLLLPQRYDEFIPAGHRVRVVDAVIDKLDLSALAAQYKGGGPSSYHPKMMLKVLVYAYSQKVDASRRIATTLRESMTFLRLE